MTEYVSSRKSPPVPQAAPKPKAPILHHAAASGGQALDAKTQQAMAARFGHDFSQVRVHTDSQASQSAQAAGASAYAVGSDIVFRDGRYAPGSADGDRLLAHELTHVVQQARHGPGDAARSSRKEDASEQEADALAEQVMEGQTVQVQAAPTAALARDEEEGGGFLSGLASGAGSLLKAGWEGTKGAAGAVYDNYEKATDFKSLQSGNAKLADESKGQFGESFIRGGINGEIDAAENFLAAGNQKMVDDSEGHWYSGLAKGSAWLNNGIAQGVGGLTKAVGDVGFGIVNGIAHPIDALSGMEGILEHNMTIPGLGTTLKAGHALYDLAAKDKPEERQYGSSFGDIANHLLNPEQQMKDDAKFDLNLAAGIIAPDKNKDGTTDWSAWKNKPVEAATRAAGNILPFFLGMGEADAAKAAEVGDAAEVANASHTPTLPGIGPDLPPLTERGMPTIPGVQPGRVPTIPGFEPPPTLPDIVPPTERGLPPTERGIPPTERGLPPTERGLPPTERGLPPTERGLPPTERGLPPTERGIPPTERGIPPTQPDMISPKATTGEVPSPVSPKATTVEMPGSNPVDPLGKTDVNPLGKTDPALPALGETPSPPVKTRNPVQQMDPVDPAQMYPGAPQPPGWRSGPVSPAPPSNMPYSPNVVAINPAEVENALAAAAKGQPLPDVVPHGPFDPFEGRGPSSQPGWMSNQKTLPGVGPEPIELMPETLDDPARVDPLGKTHVDPNGKTFPASPQPAPAKPISELFPELYGPGDLPPPSAKPISDLSPELYNPAEPENILGDVREPQPPSVNTLLKGLDQPLDPIRTRPMFDPMSGSLEEAELLLRNLR